MARCLLGLGANLGNRRQTLDRAVELLQSAPQITAVSVSRYHETRPVGGPVDQPVFLNAAAVIETTLAPEALLDTLQEIENRLGRERETRWGPRTIDLDLLLYGTETISSERLTVPHPRMAWRRFVLEPAAEVAAEMQHPGIGWTVAALRENLDRLPTPYIAIAGGIGAGKTALARRLVQTGSVDWIPERFDADALSRFYATKLEDRQTFKQDQRPTGAGKLYRCGSTSPAAGPARRPTEAGKLYRYGSSSPAAGPARQPTGAGDTDSAEVPNRSAALPPDSTSIGPQIELEFLRLRTELLTAERLKNLKIDRPSGESARPWTTDWWFDQSAAFAEVWLSADEFARFEEKYREARSQVIRPTLVVYLDVPPETLRQRIQRRGRPFEKGLTENRLETLVRSLEKRLHCNDVGPVLNIPDGTPEAIAEEVRTAIESIKVR